MALKRPLGCQLCSIPRLEVPCYLVLCPVAHQQVPWKSLDLGFRCQWGFQLEIQNDHKRQSIQTKTLSYLINIVSFSPILYHEFLQVKT